MVWGVGADTVDGWIGGDGRTARLKARRGDVEGKGMEMESHA